MSTRTEQAAELEQLRAAILDSRCWSDVKHVPDGWRKVEVYTNGDAVVVCGRPEYDDESHNCDEMGCGSVGPHVLHYIAAATTYPRGETP